MLKRTFFTYAYILHRSKNNTNYYKNSFNLFLIQNLFTGIYKQTNFEYIVGTQSGLLQFVRITIESNNKLMLTTNNCKTPVNHTKYALCGLTGSTNNAFLLMSLYAAQVRIYVTIF